MMANHRETTTLFCLPFAGGSSYSYAEFQRCADGRLRIAAIDLPGRGRRFSEPLLTNLHEMADDAFVQIRQRLDGAYAIYGHSLGAAIAYLLVKRIIREPCPPPLHLFVSGREGPAVQRKDRDRRLLPRAEFIEIVKRFAGTASEVFENRELIDLFEPVLRADFQALDTYVYVKGEPFDVPITVLRGSDENVTRADALRWQDETSSSITLLEFGGGHFFIFPNAQEICRTISRAIARPDSRD